MKPILKKIAPFISVVFFGFAIWVLHNELGQYSFHEILQNIARIPFLRILLSLLLSGLSYLLLTGYDALGVQYVGEKLSYDKIGKAGFIGYAFSHNFGMALVSGGSIRYRLYSAWGLDGVQVAKLVGFSAFTLWIGFCAMGGLSMLFYSPDLSQGIISHIPLGILAIVLLAMVAIYLAASALITNTLSLGKWNITFPDTEMALKQVFIGSLDWLIAASVLYVLLPRAGIPFFGFVGIFLLAQIIGLFSQVPGGLGVFESVMILYLSNFINTPDIVGILLVYRLIYYLLPLIAAMALLGYQEYRANRQVVNDFGSRTASWLPRIIPTAFSISIFVGGAVLLFSGSMPAEVPLMRYLQPLIPLPVIEMSHFFASLVGAALLVLAHGLQKRMDAAYHATLGVLIFGIFFTLLKGVSYIEASILAVMLIALVPSRKEFTHKASLFSETFSPVWITMILMVVIGSIGLGLFTYGNVKYQNDLWWQFTLLGDAPRYLRASVGVFGAGLIFGLYKLIRPGSRRRADSREFELAASIAASSANIQANLLFLNDKELLFSDSKNACIMYGVQDRSYISMGDPMGAPTEIEDLAWNFKELSEKNDGWPVFYQVGEQHLKLYQDLGLTLLKLGDEARLPLASYHVDDQLPGTMRDNCRRLESRGYRFEMIAAGNISTHYEKLKSVSDAWLQKPDNDEKRFSMGSFNRDYLSRFPIATVRKGEKMVCFCNLMGSAEKREIGYDVVRRRPESPSEVIDFLIVKSIRWAKQQNYGWFNLGLAPLSNRNMQKLPSKWAVFSDLLYNFEQQLYNFEGLRKYKQQFGPQWNPVYIAAPAGLTLATVLTNLSALISTSSGKTSPAKAGS